MLLMVCAMSATRKPASLSALNAGKRSGVPLAGVCHACYSRMYRRDQGRVERVAIRAERRRALADQRAKEAAERALRRCATCGRLLILTRGVVHHRARFCDSFCLYHHPSRRASRGSTRWFSTVKTKLEARKAEAEQQIEGVR